MSKKAKELEEGFTKMFDTEFLNKLYQKDDEFVYLELEKIQTRKQVRLKIDTNSKKFLSLLNSIKEHGVLHPVIVKPLKDEPDKFLLVTGHQRLEAAKLLELKTIPARIIDVDEEKIRELQFIENIQRDNLSSVDLVVSINEYYRDRFNDNLLSDISLYIFKPEKLTIEKKEFIEKILNITRKSARTLFNMLKVLELPEDIVQKIKERKISMTAGYLLSNIYEKDKKLFDQIVKKTKDWKTITPKKIKEIFLQGENPD